MLNKKEKDEYKGSPFTFYEDAKTRRLNKIVNELETADKMNEYMSKFIQYHHQDTFRSPKYVIDKMKGDCHEQAQLMKYWIEKHKDQVYTYSIWFLIEGKEDEDVNYATHSVVFEIRKEKGKWKIVWYESAWDKYKGVHVYDDVNEFRKDIGKKWEWASKDTVLYFFDTTYVKYTNGMTFKKFVEKSTDSKLGCIKLTQDGELKNC